MSFTYTYSDLKEITVKGVIPEGGHDDTDAIAEDTFHRWLPETPEAYSHDADGNLEFHARWDCTWNGEPRPEGRAAVDSGQAGRNPKGDRLAGSERSQNRLEAMETRPAAYQAGAPRERLEFIYDSQGRRVLKVHLEWDDTEETFVETRRDRFVYHGWNLLLQVTDRPDLDAAYVSQRFVWGIDLSGGMRGAGGVGGLLMVRFSGNITAYPAYDGNGKVMGLFDPSEGEWAAEYEYGAFGESLRSTGPLADRNRFRFSTKYTDSTTGLLYYGFRYLDPETGRWLNRDPIEEDGGLNLHGFIGNSTLNFVDILGLEGKALTITVEKCEIFLLFGHGNMTDRHQFEFEDEHCSRAHFLGCYSTQHFEDIPEASQMELPHQRGLINTRQMWLQVEAAIKQIKDVEAPKLCDEQCCDKVTLRLRHFAHPTLRGRFKDWLEGTTEWVRALGGDSQEIECN